MREIKFKIWIPYSKVMMQPKDIITIHESTLNGVTIGQMKQWVYLQFTGLHDKNGKDIYEGDIMKTPSGHIIKIEFGERSYRCGQDIFQCYGWIAVLIKNGHRETLDVSMMGIVIGNIYENPELLNPVTIIET